MKAPLPKEETKRLCALQNLHILDTAPEPAFDDLVALAAHVCATPIALLSLIDNERQWFKSEMGLGVRETHRDLSFCAFTILGPETMIVPDAQADERFADNSLVTGPPHIRFYAGAPLVDADGHAMGALAVIDRQPRQLDEAKVRMLEAVARQAVAQIKLRQHADRDRSERRRVETEVARVFQVSRDLICIADFEGRFRRVNPAFERTLGFGAADLAGRRFLDLVHPEDRHATETEFDRIRSGRPRLPFSNRYRTRTGDWCWLEWVSIAAVEEGLVYAIARDLTETRRLDDSLRRSEAALRAAQERAKLGNWEFDLTTRESWWSEEMYRLFDRDPTTGPPSVSDFLEQMDPEHRRQLAQVVEAPPEDPGPSTLTFSSNPALGPARHYRAFIDVLRDGQGRPVKLAGSILDITELKQTELALIEKERQQATLIENLPGYVYRCRNDQRWTTEFLSDVFTQVTAFPARRLLSGELEYSELIHPDDRQRVWDSVQEALAARKRFQLEYRINRADGQERWVREHGSGVFDDAGQVVAIEGFILDITERRLALAALQKSERRLRALVETARDAVLQVGGDQRISALNRAFEAITGWTREEWLGQPVLGLIHLTDRERGRQLIDRVLHGEVLPTFELTLRTRQDTPVVLEFTAVGEVEDGQVVGVIGIGRDLTDRRRLEEQLHLAQRMESIGQLAGGVAHDFNNILAVILMQSSLIETMEELSPSVRDGLQQIQLAAERAAGLTRQLLTFGRRQHMQLVDVDLSLVVDDLGKMLRRILGEHIELHTRTVARLPLVHADIAMLEQVVMNLVVNARDAMPRGGRITLSLCVEEGAATPAGGAGPRWVVLGVSDTGEGIAPEVMPRIFEPFFTTKEVGKGTGLGLATVYGIVQQHGGSVDVTSEPGRGTQFRVRLPAVYRRPAAPGISVARLELRGGHETVLVVEDEVHVRDLVCAVLQQKGYRVLVATSGPEALLAWEKAGRRVDLLLTDIVMPAGMNGWELAQKLQAQQPSLAVLYISGYSGDTVAQGLKLVEGTNFLQKPFGPIKLLNVVRDVLDHRRR